MARHSENNKKQNKLNCQLKFNGNSEPWLQSAEESETTVEY